MENDFDAESFYNMYKQFEKEGELDGFLEMMADQEYNSDRYTGGKHYKNKDDIRKVAKAIIDDLDKNSHKYHKKESAKLMELYDLRELAEADTKPKKKPNVEKSTFETATKNATDQAKRDSDLVKHFHERIRQAMMNGVNINEIDEEFIQKAIDEYYPDHQNRKKSIAQYTKEKLSTEDAQLEEVGRGLQPEMGDMSNQSSEGQED